ncbi:DUF6799 domain-containing protein [Hymenobacter glacieicola]|uniref:DUF6799 domain-containing protein n=1 Tax=Hymenobacter glacieicola TaxID=1562124 RepID=A0ABQ1WN92_9BACT|nr:DUF6799 domain-containing protein [Hymenobacter glacieicola]GGG37579.1 hypothetical protein GCM10011378_12350 [Hymenobacter glacieicola]
MSKFYFLLVGLSLSFGGATSAAAQKLNNDGFQRRNGQMHILRNGQVRPMLRDAHLPTGAVVGTDGFVVGPDGKRTELQEGQGCDLKGNLVSVVATAGGGLALSPPVSTPRRPASEAPAAEEVRAVLEDLLGRGRREEDQDDEREEYDEKYEEKAREQRKKEEEWQREEQKRREEHEREREKKWKEKWKKGKKWDD